MKNNEILISVKFESGAMTREMSFLVQKDMSLKALTEGLYYGLKKAAKKESDEKDEELSVKKCFRLYEDYIKTHSILLVLHTSMGDNVMFDFSGEAEDTFDKNKIKPLPQCTLTGLGIVTGSCIYITDKDAVDNSDHSIQSLFSRSDITQKYILSSGNSLEYNISTRRLNVIEDSVIDILPAGDMPSASKGSILDVILPTLISAAGMIGIRYGISYFSSSTAINNSMLAMTVAMPLVSLVTTAYNFKKQRKEQKQSADEWKEKYENYISDTVIKRITDWQRDEITYLNNVYPPMGNLFDRTAAISSSIFSRSQNDKDFMKISLGQSDEIKPMFEIKSEKKDSIFSDVKYRLLTKKNGLPYIVIDVPKKKKGLKAKKVKETYENHKNQYLLTDIPYNFANKDKVDGEIVGFKYLRNYYDNTQKPPLLIDLKSCGVLGVVSTESEVLSKFVRHIAFELAYYHSPEDLQMVFLFESESNTSKQDDIVRDYKYLPHTNELFENTSQFVFDKNSAGEVFSQLQAIASERAKAGNSDEENSNENDRVVQIVCFVFSDYDIKESAFSRYLPEAPKEGEEYINKLGLTFVFLQNEEGKLPKYCGSTIQLDGKMHKISSRYNILSRETLEGLTENSRKDTAASTDDYIEYTNFENPFIFDNGTKAHSINDFSLAYKQLSSIYNTRIAENGKVPSVVTLFELYPFLKELKDDESIRAEIEKRWLSLEPYDQYDVTRDLKVEMGRNEHGITYLDLHENADGPHMLVAGTTGSGKSETIITYLIGLCMKYSPMDLNLLLVDMKGGGFSDRLGELPHCVGSVTDTAGESEGISAVYMLKRFLESLNAELKKRKLILADLKVDNADDYIRAYRKIKRIHKLKNQPDGQKERNALIEEIRKSENEKQIEAIDGDISKLRPLSHLILVVDEFTELKRFSSESNDIDFIAEITTIARVGRTLGLHIILVSQNIEGAINDDIRVNTKSKICLKVATKQASKEMLGTPDAAAATMPGHGRAYILVGTGSRYEYFQSAYTGANKNMNIEPPVNITYVPNTGQFEKQFYISDKDNDVIKKRNKSGGTTQLKYVVGQIIELAEKFEKPKDIFLPPLSTDIHENDSDLEWEGVDIDA